MSVTVVGLYSNYLLVITAVNTFLLLIFDSATASFGNLIAQETREKSLEVFKVFNFLGFWIFGWATVCFYNLLNPFISLWIGNSYLIEQAIINIVLLNYYLVGMRVPLGVVKTAAGVYAQDRYVPLIQAAVNLTFSIILVQYWGLAGVFAGTVISSVAVVCWYRPLVVYKHVFQTSVKQYFIHYFYYALVVVINILLTDYICSFFLAEYGIINFILRSIVCLIIPNLVVIALFFRAKEFKDIAGIVNFLAGEKSWGKR